MTSKEQTCRSPGYDHDILNTAYSAILLKPSVIWDAITQKKSYITSVIWIYLKKHSTTFSPFLKYCTISFSPMRASKSRTMLRLFKDCGYAPAKANGYWSNTLRFFNGPETYITVFFPFYNCSSRKLVLNESPHVTLRSCLWSIFS